MFRVRARKNTSACIVHSRTGIPTQACKPDNIQREQEFITEARVVSAPLMYTSMACTAALELSMSHIDGNCVRHSVTDVHHDAGRERLCRHNDHLCVL